MKLQQGLRLLSLVLALGQVSCVGFPYSGVIEESRRYLVEEHPEAFHVTSGKEKIHYFRRGNVKGPVVLFVHGSPGDWAANAHFFKNERLLKDFDLVAFDRFGYGLNRQGEPFAELQEQIVAPLAILQEIDVKERQVFVVGHSYGGPVAMKLAIVAKDQVDGLVLVAAAMDPELEAMKWYQHVAKLWGLRSLIPDDLDVCNREILGLKAELEKMQKDYPSLEGLRVEVIHGTEDVLVPVENVDYMKRHLAENSPNFHVIKGMKHFVPWAFPGLIEDSLQRLKSDSR